MRELSIIMLLVMAAASATAEETLTRGRNLAVDVAADGRLVMNLAGGLWLLPAAGGDATRAAGDFGVVGRLRWSPDGSRVAFEATVDGRQGLWLYDLARDSTSQLSPADDLDLHPAWHPDGERLVYASDRRGTGLDLWETDLPTGLHWRLSNRPGDETDPAWSADGRHLTYVHHDGERWHLVLRGHGQPEEVLVSSERRIAGPSWRPDGSLVMYWQDSDDGTLLNMVILSEPRLVRTYAAGEGYMTGPVAWLDRQRFYYSADGIIRQRRFNAWSARSVPFRARIETQPDAPVVPVRRRLPGVAEPPGSLVVHAARLIDGLGGGYQRDRDIIIEGGQIVAVEAHAERPGSIVIDMGDLAVLPGFVDARARLPDGADENVGPLLLAAGITTVIAEHAEAGHLDTIWSGKALPGPRLLPAADWPAGPTSGLADSQTPGLDELLASRQARLIGHTEALARRFAQPPTLTTNVTDIVAGSHRNGLPAGIGLHAELRALVAAGLTPEQALRAAGVNAAAALGVDPALGRVAMGAAADLVFVDGDPLGDIRDALRVVAVLRNGRFFSVAGLIERTAPPGNVE